MKNNVKLFLLRTLKFLALVLPLACVIHFAQENLFYYEDYNTRRIEQFYEEEKDSLDVVVIGASETFAGYAPGYAYENYGFTSYLYSMDSNTGSIYKSAVKEIMKHQNPQVILVDIYGFLSGEGWDFYDEPRVRMFVESIPFSMNKVQTILEHPFDNKISYFVPMVKYHGELATAQERLATLNEPEEDIPDLKGVITRTIIHQEGGDPGYDVDFEYFDLCADSRKCLEDFLAYCEKANLDNIVFVNFPRYLTNEDKNSWLGMIMRVEEILNENGYELLNLQNEMEQIGIDVTRDFYNEHHLNVYGQMKVTDYLGTYMVNECQVVPTAQTAENQQKWEDCVIATRQLITLADACIHRGEDYFIDETVYAYLPVAEILNAE